MKLPSMKLPNMKKSAMLLSIALVVLATFAIASVTVQAVDAFIETVEIDGVEVQPFEPNEIRLNVERGDTIDVLVRLRGFANNSNVQVEAFISGHEPNSETMSESSDVFDVENGVSYVKRFKLKLPTNVDRDNYKLRVLVSDRYGSADVSDFNLKIDTKRHWMQIKDIILRPPFEVIAGRSLLATIQVENQGQQDEEGVKVKVSIPELNTQGTEFINEIESEKTTTSEEILLRIPEDAKPGRYKVRVEVTYNDGFKTNTGEAWIDVVAASDEEDEEETSQKVESSIAVAENNKDLARGKGGAVYPITVTNNGKTSKSYMISVDSSDWAEVSVTPSNVLVIPPRGTDTFFVIVNAKSNAAPGSKILSATISTSGEESKKVALRANVQEGGLSQSDMIKTFQVIVVILLVVLIVLGLVMAINKMQSDKEREEKVVTEEQKGKRTTKYY